MPGRISGPLRAAGRERGAGRGGVAPQGAYGCPLRADDPHAPLAQTLARALTLAGFAVHHCVQSDPLYRLGGVCLLPVAGGGGRGTAAEWWCPWTTHKLLSLDWDQWSEYQGAQAAMNPALAGGAGRTRVSVQPFGQGGASLVPGGARRHEPGAGR